MSHEFVRWNIPNMMTGEVVFIPDDDQRRESDSRAYSNDG